MVLFDTRCCLLNEINSCSSIHPTLAIVRFSNGFVVRLYGRLTTPAGSCTDTLLSLPLSLLALIGTVYHHMNPAIFQFFLLASLHWLDGEQSAILITTSN